MRGGETPETARSFDELLDSYPDRGWWKPGTNTIRNWGLIGVWEDSAGENVSDIDHEPLYVHAEAYDPGAPMHSQLCTLKTALRLGHWAPPPPRSRECPCRIRREDCRYHCEDEARRVTLRF